MSQITKHIAFSPNTVVTPSQNMRLLRRSKFSQHEHTSRAVLRQRLQEPSFDVVSVSAAAPAPGQIQKMRA